MSDITSPSGPATENPTDKGKGKAIAPEEEESDSSGEEMETEAEEEEPEVEDDEFAGLDTSNIITGGRTRGKQIDFAKAAAEQPADEDDEEDDEYAPAEETAQRGPGNDGMDIDS
ncbi:histone chaperone domain CHZ-domain-containing protein [Tuber indicum]|jgi:hypothetical protein|nr:histone chaperone domain CHZ-domain-containing protein [Tuber indicum]